MFFDQRLSRKKSNYYRTLVASILLFSFVFTTFANELKDLEVTLTVTDFDPTETNNPTNELKAQMGMNDIEVDEVYYIDDLDFDIEEPTEQPDETQTALESDTPEEASLEKEENVSSAINTDEIISANAYKSNETPSSTKVALPQVTSCKTQGQIALTYNEGPSDVTAKIARHLKKADARANFFVNATWLYTQQYAMVLQNLYNSGHFIGMTYQVPSDNLSDEQLRQDIIHNAHTIQTVIQVAPKYVRLHYTEQKDVRTEAILADLGFVLVGYNLDSLDYLKKDPTGPNSIQSIYSETFKKYKDTYDAKGSFISIQYDLPYTGSLGAVSHVINTIDEEGYTMVRMDGCLNDPEPYKKFANSTEYVNDKFSFNQQNYHQGQKAVVIDESKTAEEEKEEAEFEAAFKAQTIESKASTRVVFPASAILFTVSAIFTLFL